MNNVIILESQTKQGSLEINTRVYLSGDNSYFEIYQYLNKKGSPEEVSCNCVVLPSDDIIKIIRTATEVVLNNASKNKP